MRAPASENSTMLTDFGIGSAAAAEVVGSWRVISQKAMPAEPAMERVRNVRRLTGLGDWASLLLVSIAVLEGLDAD